MYPNGSGHGVLACVDTIRTVEDLECSNNRNNRIRAFNLILRGDWCMTMLKPWKVCSHHAQTMERDYAIANERPNR